MKKIWAVANQKGGVGKTTTAVTLAGQLSAEGERVLLIDLDPHGSLTTYFGQDPDGIELSVYTLFKDRADKRGEPRYDQVLIQTAFDNLSLLPASTALATLDRQLGAEEGMGLVIARTLQDLGERFDYVFIDCPPMLGVLMVNALAACDQLLIPVQCEFLALKGLERMLHTLKMIARARGQSPAHLIVPTMYDRRTRASSAIPSCCGRRSSRSTPSSARPARSASRCRCPSAAPAARGPMAACSIICCSAPVRRRRLLKPLRGRTRHGHEVIIQPAPCADP